MAKRRRKGGLIQSTKSIKDEDYTFRIIAIKNPLHTLFMEYGFIKDDLPIKVRVVGKYNSFNKAKKIIDGLEGVDVHYYLENINSNRMLYSKVGNSPDGKP